MPEKGGPAPRVYAFCVAGEAESAAGDEGKRLSESLQGRALVMGVDRLDYSKGLPQRLRAFRELLQRYPDNSHSATLVQIVSPSREAVAAALTGWKGSIVFVSHDTEFVEALSPTKVLLMPDGQVDYFNEDWLELVSLA